MDWIEEHEFTDPDFEKPLGLVTGYQAETNEIRWI